MVPSYPLIKLISYSPVYQVSWLHAKARKEHWEEELELVGREIEWTVRSFRHYEGMWRQRADKVESAGKRPMPGSRAQLGGSGQQWQMIHLEHFELFEYIPKRLCMQDWG